ncbi:MAG: hypothetical protein IIC90_13355 [Chloroflexi bacterium]|nr:hypothetical protein [Chloroflexota bacterium]
MPVGEYFHDTSRPLYIGLGRLVDTSLTGRLRSSTYHELSSAGYERQRVRFGLIEEMEGQRVIRNLGADDFGGAGALEANDERTVVMLLLDLPDV